MAFGQAYDTFDYTAASYHFARILSCATPDEKLHPESQSSGYFEFVELMC